MLRGTWSEIVPEEEDESRIEAYKCNICQKRFKNNYEKKEFPARGSIICHIATNHGRLIDAMKKDDKVDMSEVSYNDTFISYDIDGDKFHTFLSSGHHITPNIHLFYFNRISN